MHREPCDKEGCNFDQGLYRRWVDVKRGGHGPSRRRKVHDGGYLRRRAGLRAARLEGAIPRIGTREAGRKDLRPGR